MSTIYDYQGNPLDLSIEGSVATPAMFGAKGDGVTDDTNAFLLMESSDYENIFIPEGVYLINSFETSKSVIMDDNAWITSKTYHSKVIIISGNDNVYKLNLRLKGQIAYWGVDVEGNNNHFISIRIDGMDYNNDGANAGVMIRGNNNTFDFIRFNDFIRRSDPSVNDSCPQGVAFMDNPTNNFIAVIQGFNCRAGVVNAANYGTKNKIGTLSTVNCGDNTLYCVRGGHMDVGTILHGGSNEAVAVITDTATTDTPISEMTTVNVGTVIASTDFEFVVRLKNAGRVSIGNIIVTGTINSLIFSNTGNFKSGEIHFGNVNINGSIKFLIFLPSNRGTVESLIINNLNVHDKHNDSDTHLTTQDYTVTGGLKQLIIDNYNLDIEDAENAYSSGVIVKHELPANINKLSRIGKVCCHFDSSVFESIDFRNSASNKMIVNGGVFKDDANQTTSFYADGRASDMKQCAGVPTRGTWNVGDMIVKSDGSAIYLCTASGTPGTWKTIN